MLRRCALLFTLLLLAAPLLAQPIIAPSNLDGDLNAATGEVTLNWEFEGTGGYMNDFGPGDDLTGWELYEPEDWILNTDEDVLASSWTPSGSWWWTVAAYTGNTYQDAIVTTRMRRTGGELNWAQSMFIAGDGPFQPPAWTGFMVQVEVSETPQFNVTRVYQGSTSFVTQGWEDSGAINTGFNAWNELSVVMDDSSYTLSINGAEVFNWTDDQIFGGTVSIGGVGDNGVPQALEFDYVDFQPLQPVDEFDHFRVYRDGVLIGTTTDLTYTETLPEYGSYTYEITAYYDEGESEASNPFTVNWNPPGPSFELTPGITTIPADGGTLLYDVSANLENPQPYANVSYWTEVETPGGQTVPLGSITVDLPAFFQIGGLQQSQVVPAAAPAGVYTFHGYLGYPGTPYQLHSSFEFAKEAGVLATATGNAVWPAADLWPARLAATGDDAGSVRTTPDDFALAPVYPNPFNPTATVHVALPEAAELTVDVVNVTGRRVARLAQGTRPAGQHRFVLDGSAWPSGVYFVRAAVPGKLDAVQKVMLMK